MGYGFPAAIGAKLGNPHKDVIVISGRGRVNVNMDNLRICCKCFNFCSNTVIKPCSYGEQDIAMTDCKISCIISMYAYIPKVNIADANQEMTKLAEMTGVPVVTTIMGKGAIPTTNSLYVGNIGIHGNYALVMLTMSTS